MAASFRFECDVMLFARLSAFYFFYFSVLGLVAPYLGLYLASREFSLLEIGQLTSIFLLTKILAPNIWGAIADRSQRRLVLVRIGTVATFLGYLLFFAAAGFWQVALAIMLFSFFWNAVLPQFEVITLHNLAAQRNRYSRIRLWGSVGFIACVAGAGLLIDQFGISLFPWLLLTVIVILVLCGFWRFDEPRRAEKHEDSRAFFTELKRRPVLLFFASCLLLQLSHGAYYTYFSIFLEHVGYTKTTIGLLWALGVLAEVVLFLVMHRWLSQWQVRSIMMLALFLTGIRWLATAWFVEQLWMLVFFQCLHAFSFGAMHACSIHYVHEKFGAQNQGRAQALYSSAGFGAGGSIGAFLSGVVVSSLGYHAAFYLCAAFAWLALLAIFLQRRQ